MPRLLVVDNYDSFTYNLVQYLAELGAELEVVRDDAAALADLLARQGGAGIVADSDPHREYKEGENKARALIRAIEMAREGAD